MSKDKKYGFGIVGAGMIANFHAMAIEAIPNAQLIGVYSITKGKAEVLAAKHHCESYDSLDEMLAHPDLDIVCICTPSGIHMDPALQSIAAGKHCIIEKPLEITLERCDRIIEAAKVAGVKVGVIFPSRFYENSSRIKTALDQHRFGDLALGDANIKWSRTPEYYLSGKWRGTWEFDGGGALMNQGIHSVDLLQWYMGPVISVHASTANVRHKSIEVEDTVVATLKFKNGALGTIVCSTAVYPGSLKRIEILGTAGTAILEENNLIKWDFAHEIEEDAAIKNEMATTVAPQGGVANPADISFVGHQKQFEDMIHSIETGTAPMIDDIEGRKSVEIVLAVYESAKTGKEVYLPLTH